MCIIYIFLTILKIARREKKGNKDTILLNEILRVVCSIFKTRPQRLTINLIGKTDHLMVYSAPGTKGSKGFNLQI